MTRFNKKLEDFNDLIKKPCCEDFIMAKKKKKEDREDPDDGGEADGGSSVRHYTALGFCIYIPVCIYIPRPPPSSPSPLIFNNYITYLLLLFSGFGNVYTRRTMQQSMMGHSSSSKSRRSKVCHTGLHQTIYFYSLIPICLFMCHFF